MFQRRTITKINRLKKSFRTKLRKIMGFKIKKNVRKNYLVNFPWRGPLHERLGVPTHGPLLLLPGPLCWLPPHGLGGHRPGHVPPPHAHGQPVLKNNKNILFATMTNTSIDVSSLFKKKKS